MLFNSIEYIYLFLPFTFFVYFYLNKINHNHLGKIFLIIASLFFYSWWNFIYLPLILFSIGFNFLLGSSLSKKNIDKKNKNLLIIGISANIFLLAYFKYLDFFILNFNFIFDQNLPTLNLSLPLAISFFTF